MNKPNVAKNGVFGGLYGFGLIAGLFYFLPHTATFIEVVVAILKALFWPAVLIYHIFTLLNI